MHNKRIWTVFLCTGALAVASIGGNYLPAMSTTMCSETEPCRHAYTLGQFVNSQSAGAASNPEAIVAFADEPAPQMPPHLRPIPMPLPAQRSIRQLRHRNLPLNQLRRQNLNPNMKMSVFRLPQIM